ncbi:MAG: hypothetical protein ICV55_13130 [Coleofasciculus sp. C3-bin4]|nr:hypothetical protein [Coleofasciculus sp. C3-bin4]
MFSNAPIERANCFFVVFLAHKVFDTPTSPTGASDAASLCKRILPMILTKMDNLTARSL